jgi:general secretion pathway protein H
MRLRHPQPGFTLIELLVVIVIIGTIVSIALLSIGVGSDDEDVDRERRRFASLMEVVRDEAVLQGREFGIEVMQSSYRFVEYDPLARQWVEPPFDELYELRELPEGIEVELFIDDKRIDLQRDPKSLDDPDKDMSSSVQTFEPHLFVFASGEGTVFEIHFWRRQTDYRAILRGDVLGNMELGAADES